MTKQCVLLGWRLSAACFVAGGGPSSCRELVGSARLHCAVVCATSLPGILSACFFQRLFMVRARRCGM